MKKILLASTLFISTCHFFPWNGIAFGKNFLTPDECKTIRLDQEGSAFEHIPIWNQFIFDENRLVNIFKNCYASVATDLVDAWVLTHRDKTDIGPYSLTSHFEAAAGYKFQLFKSYFWQNIEGVHFLLNREVSESPLEHGYLGGVIRYLKRFGPCTVDQLPPPLSLAQIKQHIEKGIKVFREYQTEYNRAYNLLVWLETHMYGPRFPDELSLKEFQTSDRETAVQAISDILFSILKEHFRGDSADEFIAKSLPSRGEIEKALDHGHFTDLVHAVYWNSCQKREKLSLPQWAETLVLGKEASFNQVIAEHFDTPSSELAQIQPLSVDYCSTLIFKGPGYTGIVRGNLLPLTLDPTCALHSAIIIGRRYNQEKNQCEVLVKEQFGNHLHGNLPWETETGKVWLSVEDLARNTRALSRFKDN